jgi:hypothetical protein
MRRKRDAAALLESSLETLLSIYNERSNAAVDSERLPMVRNVTPATAASLRRRITARLGHNLTIA